MGMLRQSVNIAAKEWRLLLRNPHGLAVLFLMPAAFILVMSFALKNTLTSAHVEFPRTGWVIEDGSPIAAQWAKEWTLRNGGELVASRALLQETLRARRVQAGVIVLPQWLDDQGKPRADHIELWLSNRIQPAAASRLRAELSYSVLQLQMKMAAAAAESLISKYPFARIDTILIDDTTEGRDAATMAAPSFRESRTFIGGFTKKVDRTFGPGLR